MDSEVLLLEKMDSFDLGQRMNALRQSVAEWGAFPPEGNNVNMHIHSFLSYNSHQYSPAHIAWQARKAGLYAAAICDFDVLDGLEEFYEAALIVGLRASVHLETRSFIEEMADGDINSPGEPGVSYIMGAGFSRPVAGDSEQSDTLALYREQARRRNVELVERINAHLSEAVIDYERDVLPLTPSGNATERHIIRAYVGRINARFSDYSDRVAFWSSLLGEDQSRVEALLQDLPALEERARTRLVKRGGIGYRQPTSRTFPPAEQFIGWVLSCRAIPMVAWLDGMSQGEENPQVLLEFLVSKGAAAVNIIPERNWNIADPDERLVKREKLSQFVRTAAAFNLPINVGTEMNKLGLPFVDDLQIGFISTFRDLFVQGARILVGHSILLKYADFSYVDDRAVGEFGQDIAAKNRFFEAVGALPPLNERVAQKLAEAQTERTFSMIRDSSRAGRWIV
jgi:hypothetical protein